MTDLGVGAPDPATNAGAGQKFYSLVAIMCFSQRGLMSESYVTRPDPQRVMELKDFYLAFDINGDLRVCSHKEIFLTWSLRQFEQLVKEHHLVRFF